MKIRIMDEKEIEKSVNKILSKAENGVVEEGDFIFLTPEQLSAIFSPKRIELLHYIAKHPAKSISTIAKALQRDWKSVIRDLKYLEGFGLVELEKRGRNRIAEISILEPVVSFA